MATNTSSAAMFDWVKVTETPGWEARDSMGKLVYRDALWMFGGWFNSGSECPRDVWKSTDGATWNCVQPRAPWKHSDLPTCAVHDDKMWVMGGWYNGRLPDNEPGNEVWWSQDGAEWTQATARAEWSARVGAAAVSFKGRLWLLGGVQHYYAGTNADLCNDVWSSADGKTWDLATEHAPWPARAFHQAVVFDDKMWILGGGNYLPEYRAFSDVWYSEDGEHWIEATGAAPWNPRLWFSAVAYRDHLWVLGGWSNNPFLDWNDVWYSKNGKDWTELRSSVVWAKRHEHATFVFQNKIWVAGGHARPLSSEVWRLSIPADASL